jgi:hypothetical protein
MSGVRNTIYAPHLIVCIGNRWSVTEIPLFVNTPVLVIKCVPTCFHRLFFSSPFLTAHTFPQSPLTAASPEPPYKPIPKPRNTNAAMHHLKQEAPQTESGRSDGDSRSGSQGSVTQTGSSHSPPGDASPNKLSSCDEMGKANPNAAMKTVTDSLTSTPFY